MEVIIKLENEDLQSVLIKEEEKFEEPNIFHTINEASQIHSTSNLQKQKPFYCSYCVLKFESEDELTSHEKEHEKKLIKTEQEKPKKTKKKTKTSHPEVSIEKTQNNKVPDSVAIISNLEAARPFECVYCNQSFYFETNLKTHLIGKHQHGLRPSPLNNSQIPIKKPFFAKKIQKRTTIKMIDYKSYQNHLKNYHPLNIRTDNKKAEIVPSESEVKKLKIDNMKQSKTSLTSTKSIDPAPLDIPDDDVLFPSRFDSTKLKTYSRNSKKVTTYSRKKSDHMTNSTETNTFKINEASNWSQITIKEEPNWSQISIVDEISNERGISEKQINQKININQNLNVPKITVTNLNLRRDIDSDINKDDINKFQKRKQLTEVLQHKLDKSYKCKKCRSVFTTRKRYEVHMRLKHHIMRTYRQNLNAVKKLPKREMAETVTQNLSILKPYQCKICLKLFSFENYLDVHMLSEHSLQEELLNNSYKCKNCPQSYSSAYRLEKHRIRVHVVRKNFRCSQCNQVFGTNKDLLEHWPDHLILRVIRGKPKLELDGFKKDGDTLPHCCICKNYYFASIESMQTHMKKVHYNLVNYEIEHSSDEN